MMIDQTFSFRQYFVQKWHRIQVFDVRHDGPKWKRKQYPFIAFQLSLPQKFAASTASASASLVLELFRPGLH